MFVAIESEWGIRRHLRAPWHQNFIRLWPVSGNIKTSTWRRTRITGSTKLYSVTFKLSKKGSPIRAKCVEGIFIGSKRVSCRFQGLASLADGNTYAGGAVTLAGFWFAAGLSKTGGGVAGASFTGCQNALLRHSAAEHNQLRRGPCFSAGGHFSGLARRCKVFYSKK